MVETAGVEPASEDRWPRLLRAQSAIKFWGLRLCGQSLNSLVPFCYFLSPSTRLKSEAFFWRLIPQERLLKLEERRAVRYTRQQLKLILVVRHFKLFCFYRGCRPSARFPKPTYPRRIRNVPYVSLHLYPPILYHKFVWISIFIYVPL